MTLLAVLAIIAGIIGIVGSVVPGLPGPPVSWLGFLFVYLAKPLLIYPCPEPTLCYGGA